MTPARYPLRWSPILGAVAALGSLSVLSASAACGSRTGLTPGDLAEGDDAASDVFVRPDTGRDAPLPPLDVAPKPDVVRNDCPDAEATLIYVVTNRGDLYSFNPAAASFARIGAIHCPGAGAARPFSMAVDRKGIAYVLFDDNAGFGGLFRVSTATASCVATGLAAPRQRDLQRFGMGFSSDTNGPAETLFVAGDTLGSPQPRPPPGTLARIDVRSFALTEIALLDRQIISAELTGTGDGRLFGFYAIGTPVQTSPTAIGEIDKTSGALLAETPLPTVHLEDHWAFGFWGGDFYMFTGRSGTSEVTRLRTADGSVKVVASLADDVVGAGVSTCAPAN